MLPINLANFLDGWQWTGPQAVALLGSYARGDAGPFSDVDLLLLLPADSPKPERNTFLVDGYLVTVNAVLPEQIDGWFTEPEQVVNALVALRDAVALQDPDEVFAAVQARAQAFVWTDEMQAKADCYASRQMVGWIEEAHKGLEGLRRNDTGRLLQARFGLSWGLANTMRVQRGVLGNSDNSFFDDIVNALGAESRWSILLRTAFGVNPSDNTPTSLREEVTAGLQLYTETASLLRDVLRSEDRPLIEATVKHIERERIE